MRTQTDRLPWTDVRRGERTSVLSESFYTAPIRTLCSTRVPSLYFPFPRLSITQVTKAVRVIFTLFVAL